MMAKSFLFCHQAITDLAGNASSYLFIYLYWYNLEPPIIYLLSRASIARQQEMPS